MAQLKDYSIPELIHLLGSRYRDYRQRADMTQKEVAERAGLSVVTLMPELPPSPYLLKDNDRKVQRIRHRREKTSKPKIKEL